MLREKDKIKVFGDVVADSINLNSFNFGLYQNFKKNNLKIFCKFKFK